MAYQVLAKEIAISVVEMIKLRKPSLMFAIALCTFAPTSLFAQQSSVSQPGMIRGTITDINDAPVAGASVALKGPDSTDLRIVTTDENGYFEIRDVEPGPSHKINVRAAGFSEWNSPSVTLDSGQSEILDAKLRIEGVKTDRKSTRLNSSHRSLSRMPSSA